LKVGDLYSYSDLSKDLNLTRFYQSRSLWSDGSDSYWFRHVPLKRLKLRFMYENKVEPKPLYIPKIYDNELSNCFSPARMGMR
jgi:hypothetical protein